MCVFLFPFLFCPLCLLFIDTNYESISIRGPIVPSYQHVSSIDVACPYYVCHYYYYYYDYYYYTSFFFMWLSLSFFDRSSSSIMLISLFIVCVRSVSFHAADQGERSRPATHECIHDIQQETQGPGSPASSESRQPHRLQNPGRMVVFTWTAGETEISRFSVPGVYVYTMQCSWCHFFRFVSLQLKLIRCFDF